MSSRILVTGGAGFVGATLVRSLAARGHHVVVLDSGVAAGFGSLGGTAVDIVAADIRSSGDVAAAVAGCDSVVHLAAQASVVESITDPLTDHAINVDGSLNVLEAARSAGVRRFVFASSNAVIGGHPPPAEESRPPLPVSPYGAAKASVEAYLLAYSATFGMETVALRFSNAYGPWSMHKSSVVAAFIKAYLDGGPLTIRGTGAQTRDLVHVDDVAAAVVAALEAPGEQVATEVFQIGSGRETSILELARLVCELGGGQVAIEHGPPSAGDVPRNVSDISKATRTLGYSPRVPLRDGVDRTLRWFRDNRTA